MKKIPQPLLQPDMSGDRRVTLEQLRVFVAVARSQSFQAAGQCLGRTQSAITQSIKNLEDYLGCRLLERRQGSVFGLTEDGKKIFPEAVGILEKVDRMVQSVQQPEAKEHIRFGVPLSIGTADLHEALTRCIAENKNFKVRLISDTSMHLVSMLESGSLDAAILNESMTDVLCDKHVVTHTFLEEPLVWVLSKNSSLDWTDEVPFIAFSEGSPWTQAAVNALHDAGVPHYFVYTSPSFESICSAVGEGMGITVLPISRVPEEYVFVEKDHRLPTLPKVRTVIRVRTKSAAVYDFCDLIGRIPILSRAEEYSAKSGQKGRTTVLLG